MNKIKYIFFDLGYTLVNEDAVWQKRCLEQSQTDQAKAIGVTAERLLQDIADASVQFKSQFKSVIEKYAFTFSAPYRNELETLYDDTIPVLEKLSNNFCLGIIANQSGDLSIRLREWKIDKCFSTVISSSDYDFSKPDERLFIAALKKSGVTANECAMVGDRLDNDIFPANKLGFTTVRIKRGFAAKQVPPSSIYAPKYEIDTLIDILSIPFVADNLK